LDFDQASDECVAGRVVRRPHWHPDRVVIARAQPIIGLYHFSVSMPPHQLDASDLDAEDWIVVGALQ
jgi:hypothetical protein